MLRHLIAFCLSRRPLALVAFAAFLGIGYAAFTTLNVEAYPDPAPPIVEIIAQYPGQSPEEVERYVTIPLEIAVASTPGLTYIRSNTVFALGFIRLQFEYGRDYNFVRQQVINRLKDATLPTAVTPVISPAGGISEILRYQLKGPPGMDLIQLKTLQDWAVERKLRIVPGVADVAVLGGKTKEYRAAIERINSDGSLPPGVKIDAFYDRGDLVAITVRTVMHNMLFGIALIFLIQWMFLGNLRCALIVAATIPVALFLAVIITVLRGDSANLLSVGAIDLGIIVDGTVIMVENVFRHLAHHAVRHMADREASLGDRLHRILTAAVEVDKAILFSVIITIAAFLPLFTMQGVEGQIFGPMARTYAYALLGALIATFTVTPVMSSLLLPDKVAEVETFLVRKMRQVYQRVLGLAVRNARLAAMIALAFLVVCGGLGMRLGTEFLPKLEEGNLWLRALLPPTITLDAGRDTVDNVRTIIASYPPVRTVVSEQGRGEDATDPDGSFVAEFFVPLKPFEEWPAGLTKPKLVKELAGRLEAEFIGIDFNFSQYIQDNIEEAVSGVKGENSVKIFGRDLYELERLSKAVKDELAKVPGIQDPGAFQLLGQPNLVIEVDRAKAARYGITVNDMNTVVQAAIGGQEVTRIYEGEMNFPLTVRLAPQYRDNIDAIRSVPVGLPNSDPKSPTTYIALGDVATVRLETGAAYIYRQNTERFVPIKYSVRGRDLGSTVGEAQERIAKNVVLKEGYRLEWSGEFGALVEAKKRLAIIVPLSLVLIMMLLYSLFNSIRDSLLALSGIPFAACGGILGLYVFGLNASVSAAVGFISLFGVSAMDGILLVSYIRRNLDEGHDKEEAIIGAAQTRMRQIFMTGL